MTDITVHRSNKLIAIYKDGTLVATGDKFTKQRELDLCISQHGGKDCTVKEAAGTFTKFSNIPETLKQPKGK